MVDTTRTKAQLRAAIASKLGLLNAGNVVSGDDGAIIDDAVDDVFRELEEEGLIAFDIDGDAIEVSAFKSLAYIIANHLTEDFAVETEIAARIEKKAMAGLLKLQELANARYIPESVKGDYF